MKDATKAIQALRAAQPVRGPDDPLREFLSLVTLRDHARLLMLTMRRLHVGEKAYDSRDLAKTGQGQLVLIRVPWWRLWYRVREGDEIYRIE